MNQLEKILARIKAHTITYEALYDSEDATEEQTAKAWNELAEAYADEAKELNRIDIEGENE